MLEGFKVIDLFKTRSSSMAAITNNTVRLTGKSISIPIWRACRRSSSVSRRVLLVIEDHHNCLACLC